MRTVGIEKLLSLDTPFIDLGTIQGVFGITRESARTKASRLRRRGILVRVHRNLYTLANTRYSLFALANALHQPSVVSLETALNYWGVIVQVPQVIFSVSLKSRRTVADATAFVYRRLVPSLFRFGQTRVDDFYITDPEKAFLDTLYMQCNGLAELLPEDVDMGKLDPARLDAYCRFYPAGVGRRLARLRRTAHEAE